MSDERSKDRLDWEAREGQQPPRDFAERVTLMVDGAEDDRPLGGQLDWDACEPQQPARSFADRVAEHAAETDQVPASELGVEPAAPAADEPGRGKGPARRGARRAWWTGLSRTQRQGLAVLAVGAAAAVAVLVLFSGQRPDPTAVETPVAAWRGVVMDISRAAGGTAGLSLCNPAGEQCHAARAGEAIRAGAVLRCDDRTRAHIKLDDGTMVTLDRSTELALVDRAERRARLTVGAIVTEVTKIAGKTATFELPNGHVEVLGTKFALRTSEDASTVDVSRGAVKLVDTEQRSVVVRAGEEGRAYPGAAPYVTAAPALGQSLAWSESESSEEHDKAAVRGLGELRAKKPGADEELEGAVRLTSHQVKVRIVDHMARTEVDEVFTNTTDQVLEGIYRFPLPADGHIESLALEVDGKLEQGAFVERERAAKIWRGAIVNAAPHKPVREEIIWVPGPWKDPALLEWQRGGRFELRIFPIPSRGSRRVVLSYTQVVKPTGGLRRYVYPLAHDPSGASQVGHFALDVQLRGHDETFGVRSHGYELTAGRAGGAQRLSLTASDFVPTGDLTVEYALPDRDSEVTAWSYQPTTVAADPKAPASQAGPVEASKGGDSAPSATAGVSPTAPFVAIALRPELPRQVEQLHRAYVLTVDASRSMIGERYRRAAALAVRVVRELDRLDRVTVLACDSTCQTLPGGLRAPGAQAAADAERFLAGIQPEGGSDVTAAIRSARASAGSLEGRALRVIYIGDGTPTVGPLRPAFVTRAVQGVMPADGTLTAVAIGADADLDALGALARGGSGSVIPYVPGQRLMETAFAILGASYGMGLSDVRVELPDGLTEVAPRQLDTIARGSEALLVARLSRPSVSGELVLRGKVGDEDFEQRYPLQIEPSSGAGNAFVPRLYAALRIAELERSGGAAARQEAVALSSQYNVASRYTSLLVLESQAMFRAFGLDNTRRAPEWTGEEDTERTEGRGILASRVAGRQFPVA
ncbi:MAG: FecR domain-containing protein [Deltaproteobacteria bacterium]|nr:FecR domain-containing protein [Deltaproteobacteria bacterium]